MAQLCGDIVIVGTIGNVCFYEMDGKYYARSTPGITRRAFYRYKKYAVQRESIANMQAGAKLASALYQQIPAQFKQRSLYYSIQKRVNKLFRQYHPVEEIITLMVDQLLAEGYIKQKQASTVINAVQAAFITNRTHFNRKPKKAGYYTAVRFRVKDGPWIRLYHEDELELLHMYDDEIDAGSNTWLADFLVKRKQLPSYRLKHKRKRIYRKKITQAKIPPQVNPPAGPNIAAPVFKQRLAKIPAQPSRSHTSKIKRYKALIASPPV